MPAALLILPPPLLAANHKGDKLRNQARQEEVRGNFDHALELANEALAADPGDPAYTLVVRRVTFEDGMMHVGIAGRLRDEGRLDQALSEYEKALAIDPALDIAAQEIRRTREMIEREKNGGAAVLPSITKEGERTLTPAQLARKQAEIRTASLLPVPQLRPLNPDLIDLKMLNQRPRILFETVAKVAGVNVLFQPDYDTTQAVRAASIDLSRTTLEQALDELGVVTKSFWKPLSANTIFVAVDNPTNRREYGEQVVKVFYLSNLTAPTEMNEILTVLRTVLDAAKVFQYTAQNAVIVRADADTMALVEKLISDLDKPRAEVVIDVMVMEASSTYIRNLSAAFAGTGINTSAVFAPRPGITTPGLQSNSSSGSTGSTPSSTTTPTGTTGTTGTSTPSTGATEVPLSALHHLSSADFSLTTLPGATFEAVLNDSSTRVLQAPQIRAVSNAKAELKIGQKVPTASGSFQPGVAGVGVSPLVNTQFTYLDVGVNVSMTPQVMDGDEVALHLDLDVSQVNNYQNIGGINQPVIGQNKITSDIRLKEGEVNLIGGIIQQTDSKSTTGIPGLGTLPVIGHLFSAQNIEKDRTELVVALIPHIVRSPSINPEDLKGVASGNIGQIKVNYGPQTAPAQQAEQPPDAVSAAAPPQPAAPPATAPAIAPAAGPPPVTAPPVTAPPAAAPASTPPPVAVPPATAPPGATPPATAPPIGRAGITLPGAPQPGGPQPGAVQPGAVQPGAPQPAGPARIRFQPASAATPLNSTVTVTLYAEDVRDLKSVAAQFRYDPRVLRINSIVVGDLPQRNAAPLSATRNILNDTGQADISVSRGPQESGVSGAGALFTVVFQAVGQGATNVSIGSLNLAGADGQPLQTAPPAPLQVTVN